MSRAEEED
jgi:hypothetical protein